MIDRPKSIGQAHRVFSQMEKEIERLESALATSIDNATRLTTEGANKDVVLADIAGQSKSDELGDASEDADYAGAYDIMIQLARSVTRDSDSQDGFGVPDEPENIRKWFDGDTDADGLRHLYKDGDGVIHSCEVDTIHRNNPDTTLVWTTCGIDVPANKSYKDTGQPTCLACADDRRPPD